MIAVPVKCLHKILTSSTSKEVLSTVQFESNLHLQTIIMRRKKLPYSIRLIRVSLKWTWHAFMMIAREMILETMSKRKGERQYR